MTERKYEERVEEGRLCWRRHRGAPYRKYGPRTLTEMVLKLREDLLQRDEEMARMQKMLKPRPLIPTEPEETLNPREDPQHNWGDS